MRTIVRIILSTVEKYFWNLVRIRNLICLQLKESGEEHGRWFTGLPTQRNAPTTPLSSRTTQNVAPPIR